MRKIMIWNDVKILDANPRWSSFVYQNMRLDYRIQLHYRSEPSALTYTIMKYFRLSSDRKCEGVFSATPACTSRGTLPPP